MADTKGKRVEFDIETWQALDLLARGRMMTFQELADEAFRDLLKKYDRPYDVHDAFRRSAAKADQPAANSNVKRGKKRVARKSKRPTGGRGRRARS